MIWVVAMENSFLRRPAVGQKNASVMNCLFFPFLSGFVRSIFQGGGRVSIYWRDFMKADLSQANVIYLYLIPRAINKVYNKIMQEVSLGTTIITKGSQLLSHEPDDKIVIDKSSGYGLYIYKIK